jgi:hypothetical protein
MAGLALLITAEQQCREQDLELRLVATTGSVLRAQRVTGLDVLFAITPPWSPRPDPTWVRSGLSGPDLDLTTRTVRDPKSLLRSYQ